ncbi:hypothetical protein DN752_02905 [Echinicola strongylocentroti]|uniref:Uncharacterized protein n=1 Tax=Echinicola strongylocentroti TaxID=1795355 RepID=A0A2Z4IFE1_9BACT|nr:hypothetical protein DN752_02905 [Echinicola strongylocentroti]
MDVGWKRVWQLAAASCHGFHPLRPPSKPRSDGFIIELRLKGDFRDGKGPTLANQGRQANACKLLKIYIIIDVCALHKWPRGITNPHYSGSGFQIPNS